MLKVYPFSRSRAVSPDFQQLLRPHVNFLYRLAYRFTGVAADAEDLVQDTLLKLLPRVHEMRALDKIRPWLARVLYRQFVDFVRKRGRTPSDPAQTGGDEVLEEMTSDDGGPEELADRELQYEQVLQALDRLGTEHRVVVAMHDIAGYSLEEMEEILETPVGTLKSRLHRARNRLRAVLAMEPVSGNQRV